MSDTKKFYYWGDDKPPIYYRPGTSDEHIINSILVNQGEYFFPAMKDCKLCFDIGANIGIVSVILTHIYPNAIIHSFEPQEENFALLQQNTKDYPNIGVHNYGLASTTGKQMLYPSDNPINLGGFSTVIKQGDGSPIRVRSVAQVCSDHGIPTVIKIDVEGAECDILGHFPHLNKVRWIAGEMHGEDAEYLLLHRLSATFKLAHQRGFDNKVWPFQAVNKSWTDFGRDPSPGVQE